MRQSGQKNKARSLNWAHDQASGLWLLAAFKSQPSELFTVPEGGGGGGIYLL